MVNYLPQKLDSTFGALADPTRRAILSRLARGPASVGQIAAPFRMSLPAVSKHVRVLESAGLVARKRQGREHRIALVRAPLVDAARWLTDSRRFWEGALDRLAEILEKTPKQEEPWPHRKSSAKRRSSSNGSSPRPPRKSSTPGSDRKS